MVDQALLVQELTRFARMLVTAHPVGEALHDLVDAAPAIFGIHGAGVSLDRGDRLVFATALPEDIAVVELAQEREQAGPCVEAFRTGVTVLVTDLAVDQHPWPGLGAAARGAGIRSVAAVPLHLDDIRLGTLGLYDSAAHAWSLEEVQAAELLAALTTGYLTSSSRLDRARETGRQLQEALDSRVVIEQAKGVLAGDRGIPVDRAFEVLRAHARANQESLRDVATAVVERGLRP